MSHVNAVGKKHKTPKWWSRPDKWYIGNTERNRRKKARRTAEASRITNRT